MPRVRGRRCIRLEMGQYPLPTPPTAHREARADIPPVFFHMTPLQPQHCQGGLARRQRNESERLAWGCNGYSGISHRGVGGRWVGSA